MDNNLNCSEINTDAEMDLTGLELDDLQIMDFLDEETVQQSGAVSKVMAASCTTCECCCSCVA